MREHAHGTRRRYQQGCRCAPCSAANTAYSTAYRARRRAGRPVLGAHVAGTDAARVVAALVEEGYLKGQIARWLGYRWPVLHPRPRVTIRLTLRLRAIQRRMCA